VGIVGSVAGKPDYTSVHWLRIVAQEAVRIAVGEVVHMLEQLHIVEEAVVRTVAEEVGHRMAVDLAEGHHIAEVEELHIVAAVRTVVVEEPHNLAEELEIHIVVVEVHHTVVEEGHRMVVAEVRHKLAVGHTAEEEERRIVEGEEHRMVADHMEVAGNLGMSARPTLLQRVNSRPCGGGAPYP
jgi:hypothetical protein